MRAEVVEFDQLSDSREMLEAIEPNFIVIFIYLLLVILLAAFTWMWFGEIDITVKANGILRPQKKVSVVNNINGGKINEITYQEGREISKGDLLYIIDSTILDLQYEKLIDESKRLEKDIRNLELLKRSYIEGNNLINTSNMEFFNRYMVYKYNYKQLELDLSRTESRYTREQKLSSSSTTKSRMEELKAEYQLAKLAFDRFKSESLVSIKHEIENKKDRLIEVESQLENIKNRIDLNNVKAPISGTIQVLQEFNVGDYIPSGIEVLRIIPEDGEQYKVEIMVQNKDISQLEPGLEIKYRFLALSYKEYGTLDGKITNISEDAIVSQSEANMAYRKEATINSTDLIDKNGKPTKIQIVAYLDISTVEEELKEELIVIADLLIKVIQKELKNKRYQTVDQDKSIKLSDKQKTILKLLVSGRTEVAVADEIGISVNTVKYHKRNIYKILETDNLCSTIVKVVKLGLLEI